VQGSGEGPLSVCVCKPVSSTFWLPWFWMFSRCLLVFQCFIPKLQL
jgi:hypothetical protein